MSSVLIIDRAFRKLEEWDSDDEFGPAKEKEESFSPRPSRVIVLKYMFTLDELKDDPTLLIDLKEDVREECESLGVVTNVVLYDVSNRRLKSN
jgi:HIV Tat-specific factor 1